MLDDGDLDAATSAGIVTQQQADALRQFAANRQAQSAVERVDDERFRFLSGFNDVFFAVGIVLFGLGLSFFAVLIPFGNVIAAVITWALSELVVRRLRLVLPGILLACVFSYFAVAAFSHDWPWLIARLGLPSTLVPRFGSPYSPDVYFYPPVLRANAFVVSCAATLFYARFKLPFALLLIAAGLVVFAQAGVWYYSTLGMSFTSIVLLVSGLAVFGAAMAYDLSDRDRVTRRADCAFWLHLLAAPLIVHSLIQLLVPSVIFGQLATSMTIGAALIVVGVIAALTIVALLIDRRALFVSALSYLGIVIGYTITSARGNWQGSESFVIFSTLLILGALVLSLGVTWQPLRRVFIRLFPTSLTNRLPRVAPA